MRCLNLAHLPAGHACTFAHWQYAHTAHAPNLHTHDHHELFWVEEGAGLHWINGETRPLTAGLLVLVRADDAHGFTVAQPGATLRFVNFAFPRTLWRDLWQTHLARRPVYFAEKDHRRREWPLDPTDLDRLRLLARDLHTGARDLLATDALLRGIISLLAALATRRKADRLPAWLAGSLDRIQQPRHFALGTREFARLAGCSPEHLARATRRYLDRTPTAIVNEARFTYAARQLCTTERPILDIIAACGLENLGHFYKLFRIRFGTSPDRYRRHNHTPVQRQYGGA